LRIDLEDKVPRDLDNFLSVVDPEGLEPPIVVLLFGVDIESAGLGEGSKLSTTGASNSY
jgi:hypothetical protein